MAPPSSRVSTPPSSECSLSADINGPFPLRGTNLKTEYQNRAFRMYFHTLLYPVLRPSQPLPHGPERPRPVGVCVLAFSPLGVGHRRPLWDEHGIVAEPTRTPRSLRQSPWNLTPEGAHGPVRLSKRDDANSPGRAILALCEHPEQALVPDAPHEPLGERPGKPAPRIDHEPRVLDQNRHIRSTEGRTGRAGLLGHDLGRVDGLYLWQVQVGPLQRDAEDILYLATLVLVGGNEDGFHGFSLQMPTVYRKDTDSWQVETQA